MKPGGLLLGLAVAAFLIAGAFVFRDHSDIAATFINQTQTAAAAGANQ